jgi:hypothetical protein
MLAGNTAYVPPNYAYESIATVTIGSGGASSAEFTSIPGTYTHLQIRGIVRSTDTSEGRTGLQVQFNSDTASNYSRHNVIGDGASASSEGQINQSSMFGVNFMIPSATATSNTFAGIVFELLDYANTNKYKTARMLIGFDNNGTSPLPGRVGLESSSWRSTSAVTSIKLFPHTANFAQYTTFALYGIKGA